MISLPRPRTALRITAGVGLVVVVALTEIAVSPPELTPTRASRAAEILDVMDYPHAARAHRILARRLKGCSGEAPAGSRR